jgi:hypothetical protein
MTKESKGIIIALLVVVLPIFTFFYLHWNGFLNPNPPPMKVGTCMTYEEEFLDMSAVQRIERVGKTQVQVSYICSYAITKALYTKDKSLIRRYYVEVPCECKE